MVQNIGLRTDLLQAAGIRRRLGCAWNQPECHSYNARSNSRRDGGDIESTTVHEWRTWRRTRTARFPPRRLQAALFDDRETKQRKKKPLGTL